MYMADTFCSFTRNFFFKSCFLLSEYGRVDSHPFPLTVKGSTFWVIIDGANIGGIEFGERHTWHCLYLTQFPSNQFPFITFRFHLSYLKSFLNTPSACYGGTLPLEHHFYLIYSHEHVSDSDGNLSITNAPGIWKLFLN